MANRCIFSFGDVQNKKVGGTKNLCNFSYCRQLWRDFGRFEKFKKFFFFVSFLLKKKKGSCHQKNIFFTKCQEFVT